MDIPTIFWTTGEVARRIRRQRHWVIYHIEAGHLPDAATRLGGRRLFTSTEVEAIENRVQAMANDDACREEEGALDEG